MHLLRKPCLKRSVLTLGNIKSCLRSRSTRFLFGANKSILLHVKSLIFTSFLIPYRERASLRASERYGVKSELMKTISGSLQLIICLLHITCFKKSSHQVEVQESVDKTAKQFFPPNLTPGVS